MIFDLILFIHRAAPCVDAVAPLGQGFFYLFRSTITPGDPLLSRGDDGIYVSVPIHAVTPGPDQESPIFSLVMI